MTSEEQYMIKIIFHPQIPIVIQTGFPIHSEGEILPSVHNGTFAYLKWLYTVCSQLMWAAFPFLSHYASMVKIKGNLWIDFK